MHEHLINFLKEEGFSEKEISKKPDLTFSHVAEIMQKYAKQQLILHGVVFNEADYLYQTCDLGKEIMCRCKNDRDCRNQSKVELCEHNGEEILHQGNGFVYKTCADCGADI